MRILRYGDPDWEGAISFHRDVTVLSGMRAIDETHLVATLAALLAGRPVEAPVELEVDGEAVILGVGDHLASADSRFLDHVTATARLAELVADHSPAVVTVARRLEAARKGVRVLEEAVAATLAHRDQLVAERRRRASEVDVLRRRAEAMLTPNEDDRALDLARMRIERLERLVTEVRELPVDALTEAHDQLVEVLDSVAKPDPEAQELADRWKDAARRVAELEERLAAEGRGPQELEERLDSARRAVNALELGGRRGIVNEELVRRLEEAHEEALTAESKPGRLRRSGRAKRAADARQLEQELLEQLGYSTWTNYVMGTAGMDAHGRAIRLGEAYQSLEVIEAEWEALSAELAEDPEHAGLLEEMAGVYDEAIALLGYEPDDMEAALRSLTLDGGEVEDPTPYALRLVGALRKVGVTVADDADPLKLVQRAAEAAAALTELQDDAETQAAQAEHLRELVDSVIAGGSTPDRLAAELSDEMHEDAAALEQRASEEEAAVADLDERVAEVDEEVTARATLRDTAIAGTRNVGHDVLRAVAESGAMDAELQTSYLMERLSELSAGTGLPIVLDHAVDGLEHVGAVMDVVGGERGDTQLIVITAREDVASWAQRLGDGGALVTA